MWTMEKSRCRKRGLFNDKSEVKSESTTAPLRNALRDTAHSRDRCKEL